MRRTRPVVLAVSIVIIASVAFAFYALEERQLGFGRFAVTPRLVLSGVEADGA